MTVFEFENRVVNLGDFPPAPVTWFLCLVDTLCLPLQCSDWRDTLEVPEGSWLSYSVPSIVEERPKLLGYSDFLDQQQEMTSPWSPSALYKFAFETPSTVLGDVLYPVTFVAVLIVLFLLRRINAHFIPYFSSLGRESARRSRGDEWVKVNELHVQKHGEYVYQLLCHGSLALYGLYYFHSEDWWPTTGTSYQGTKSLYEGFPYQHVVRLNDSFVTFLSIGVRFS
jgi:hypothetical protein